MTRFTGILSPTTHASNDNKTSMDLATTAMDLLRNVTSVATNTEAPLEENIKTSRGYFMHMVCS